jgi:ribulose-phosphate 3-epimerase
MAIISPSLLSCNFMNIESDIRELNKIENIWLHLDIMDGHFVPNMTFGHPVVEQLSKIASMPLDAHFMVSNPEFYIDTFKNYKLHNFTFHIEACDNTLPLIRKAKQFYPSVGISIKPNTSSDEITDEMLLNLDLVLVMSVEPGFGGQKFMPMCFDKIKSIKARALALKTPIEIQVDGGIGDQNAKELIDAGATNLVAGSYIFKNGQSQFRNQIDSIR